MDTFIQEQRIQKLRNPCLLIGFPGLGYIGKMCVTYLIKTLKARKFATLYSPFFPHHIIIGSNGKIRLPRAQFYLWKNPSKGNDVLLLTGDSQAQGYDGQYQVADKILNYIERSGVKTIITLGGYKTKETQPKVVCLSSSNELLNKLLEAGAQKSPTGNPTVGIAGLILGLTRFRDMDAACLLGGTRGYALNPVIVTQILQILQNFIGLKIDLSLLKEEIRESRKVFERIGDIQKEMEQLLREKAEIEGRVSYIS